METSPRDRILRHPLATATVEAAGGLARHAVGGTVRDALLGFETRDLDISVAESGEALAKSIARAVAGTAIALGGDRFSSYRVVAGAHHVDIWDRRGGSLRADLARRDLTINSIACDLAGGDLDDPFGGRSDLGSRILRATRLDCFERDPLRVLRLARFHHTLANFEIDLDTVAAARTACPNLSEVAVERIRDELGQILSVPPTSRAFGSLEGLGALTVVFPEAQPQTLLAQAERLDRASGTAEGKDRLLAALALLIASDAKAPQNQASVEDRAASLASDFERRGLATRETSRRAARLATARLPENDDQRRFFLAAHGDRWPMAVAVATARDATPLDRTEAILAALERLAEIHPELLLLTTPLLDGHETAGILGVAPGPEVGEALRALVRQQILGRIHSPDEARDYLRKRVEKTGEYSAATWSAPADAD